MTSSAIPKIPTRRGKTAVDQKDTTAVKTTKSRRSPTKKPATSKSTASKTKTTLRNRKGSPKSSAGKDARSLQISLENAYDASHDLENKQKNPRAPKKPTRRGETAVDQKDTTALKTTKSRRSPTKKPTTSKSTVSKTKATPRNSKDSPKQTAGIDVHSLQITLEKTYDSA